LTPYLKLGNQYILVVHDYFSKWSFTYAIPNQKADWIVRILQDNVFVLVGRSSKLSHILRDLCLAFGIKKSRTAPYGLWCKKSHTTSHHSMGDGLVEKIN